MDVVVNEIALLTHHAGCEVILHFGEEDVSGCKLDSYIIRATFH